MVLKILSINSGINGDLYSEYWTGGKRDGEEFISRCLENRQTLLSSLAPEFPDFLSQNFQVPITNKYNVP